MNLVRNHAKAGRVSRGFLSKTLSEVTGFLRTSRPKTLSGLTWFSRQARRSRPKPCQAWQGFPRNLARNPATFDRVLRSLCPRTLSGATGFPGEPAGNRVRPGRVSLWGRPKTLSGPARFPGRPAGSGRGPSATSPVAPDRVSRSLPEALPDLAWF